MAIRPAQTTALEMEVRVHGKLEWRRVAKIERRIDDSFGRRHFFMSYIPELAENETCEWYMGSSIPEIVFCPR